MTKQARSDLTKQARSNDNTYHADKSKGTGGNKRDSRSSQPSQGDILAIYEAVSQVYPDVRSQLLEPVRHDPVDVLVATIRHSLPMILSAAVRFPNSSHLFPTGKACSPMIPAM